MLSIWKGKKMGEYSGLSLHDELAARFAEAEKKRLEEEFLSRGWTPPASRSTQELTPWKRVGQGLKHDFEDMLYGAKNGLSGATFGASDWVLRKLGVTDDDYLAEREAEGLGGAVKGAGMAAELGGNMLGAGGALVKGLGKAGLKGLKLASTAGGVEGAVYGLTGSDTLSEVPQNMSVGAVTGAAVPVGLHGGAKGVKAIMHPFSSRLMAEGIKRGQSGYRDYVAKHGTDEVLDFVLHKEIPNSNIFGNVAPDDMPVKMIDIQEITPKFEKAYDLRNWLYNKFDQMKDVHVSSTNEKVDFSKSGARRILKTVRDENNTMYYPQLDEIVVRGQPSGTRLADLGHINSVTGQNIYHTGIKYNGAPYSFEFYVDQPISQGNRNFAGNKVRKIQERDIDVGFLGHTDTLTPDNYTLADLRENVNSNLPHISSLYEGLTPFQSSQLDDIIRSGLSKTNAKAGSLDSMYNVVQGVNDKITQAQTMNNLSRLSQLQELKGRLDAVMPEGFRNAGRQPMRFGNFAIPYWSDFVIRNPNLAAGLSATAANNIMQSRR